MPECRGAVNSRRPKAPCPLPLSLARRQDTLSTRKSPNFLPVGKDFTIPAPYFLPVGNGLRGSTAKMTKRHDSRGRRTHRGKAVRVTCFWTRRGPGTSMAG